MGLRISKLAILAALLAAPCVAEERLDARTAEVLNAAIAAFEREDYASVRNLTAQLARESLTPFERSRVEQLEFNAAFREKRYADAHGHLQRAIAAGGLSDLEVSQARYQDAQLLMAEERWPEGVAALEAWFETAAQPTPSAHYLLAVGYYQTHDFAKALPAARAAIERMQQPQESWLSLLASLHLQQKQYPEAVAVLNQLISVAPDNKRYWLQLSSVYGQLEKYADALAIMQVAYNSGRLTESTEIHRLADLLLFNDLPLRAAEVLDESLLSGRVPRDETTYAKLANARLAAGEFDAAVEPLEQAGELGATGSPFVRLGEVHIQRQDWPMAEAALQRAIAKGGLDDPGSPQFLLGIVSYEQGRLPEAIAWFTQARSSARHREHADRYIAFITSPSTRL